MKFRNVLWFAVLVFCGVGCSTEFDQDSFIQAQDKKPWTDIEKPSKGFGTLDVRDVTVLDDRLKDENGIDQVSILKLNDIIKKTNKTKAVIQVVETFPTGGLCRGCVNKGNLISRAILKDQDLSKSTAYIMVISGKYTPSDRELVLARSYADKGIKIVRDIDGKFQKSFGDGKFPVTLVLDSKYQGKILNIHRTQPSGVVRVLKSLSK